MTDKSSKKKDEIAARGRSPDFGTAKFNQRFGHPKLPVQPKDNLTPEAIDAWLRKKEDWLD